MRGRRNRLLIAAALFYALDAVLILIPQLLTNQGIGRVQWAIYSVVTVLFATLSLVMLVRRPDDFRVRLFALVGVVIALYFIPAAWDPRELARPIGIAFVFFSAFIRTIDFVFYIHLAAVIPSPNPLAYSRRWFIAAHYIAGVILSLVAFAIQLPYYFSASSEAEHARLGMAAEFVGDSKALYAGILMLVMLGWSANHARTIDGRRQALICFLGVVPWTLSVARQLFFPWTDSIPFFQVSAWVVVLFVPLSFFIAMFGFRLFELGLFIRKSLIYGLTTGIIAAAVYVVVAGFGLIAIQRLGAGIALWGFAVVLIVAGVAVQPLLRRIAHGVDRTLFPEKYELQQLGRNVIPELAEFTDVGDAANHLATRLAAILNLSSAAVLLADEDGDFFRTKGLAGEIRERFANDAAVLTRNDIERWLPSREDLSLYRSGDHVESRELQTMLDALEARYIIPVEFREKLIGVVLLGDRVTGPISLDESDVDTLRLLVRQASAMLENARLFEMATRDPLTQLPRRHVFENELDRELQRATRGGGPMAVAMADADDFKKVNDEHGHLVGDKVLKAIAAALASEARATDTIARYGGEEFAMLFPQTGREGAITFADKLRRRVAEEEVEYPGGSIHVTISIGVATTDGHSPGTTPQGLISTADEALYEAKRAGKNRVVVRGPMSQPSVSRPSS